MDEKIINLLSYHPYLRVRVIAYVLHTTHKEIGDALERLCATGRVKRKLIYGAYFYAVNDEPKT